MNKFCNLVYLTDNNDYSLYEIDKKKILLEWNFAYIDKVNNGLKEFFLTKSENYIQLNYLYDFTEKMIKEETTNPLIKTLKPYLEEFRLALWQTGFITTGIKDYRNRHFSLIQDNH